MNGTDAQVAALRQEYDQLRQSTDLTQVTDTVWRLTREVGGFEARVEALRQGRLRVHPEPHQRRT